MLASLMITMALMLISTMMIVVVSHLSKLTETLRRSCSPTPPHWAGLTSPDRWKPGKNLIVISSWNFFDWYFILEIVWLISHFEFFDHFALGPFCLCQCFMYNFAIPETHPTKHRYNFLLSASSSTFHHSHWEDMRPYYPYPKSRGTTSSPAYLILIPACEAKRWPLYIFILFYKTYPEQQKYTKSSTQKWTGTTSCVFQQFWIEYAALVWRADGGWCVSPLCVDNSIIMDGTLGRVCTLHRHCGSRYNVNIFLIIVT